ncbi:MAG: hypothetical protein HOM52_10565 [Rhodospirillaceae bacterium]|nr:hypothetical protein [Rhodospirillaceae bacterium]MBT3626928.1 hypothetical protein [Rhodospirillaceae bacterium]MBT3926618.1 hypothetical protein [Rhodospirillaceae bacterium]MBT5038943.1 hypothetical protein [Rhodospirillaceae bacterium]MBT5674219.1 hypothetical protein [Rhodospirillaceae bacterium]
MGQTKRAKRAIPKPIDSDPSNLDTIDLMTHSISKRKTLRLVALAFAFLLTGATSAFAQDVWTAAPLDAASRPAEVVAETRQSAPGGIPHGLVETHDGGGDITAAWYEAPTDTYRHGILGDAIEASTLLVELPAGAVLSFRLPVTEVFEDLYPRLADLDADGKLEVVTIRSSISLGASVTVYGLRDGILMQLASTAFIGRPNRWLNIAGIARFRGTSRQEIAYVETPHIGGTLYFYEFVNEGLERVGTLRGFSNHEIGSTELRLSAVADINGNGRMDLAVPSANRRTLRIVGFGPGGLTSFASSDLPSRIDKAIAVEGFGKNLRFVVGLENGDVYEIRR